MSQASIDFLAGPPAEPSVLGDVAVLLHPDDDVAIAKTALPKGSVLLVDAGEPIHVRRLIPAGHKLALRRVALGGPVHRYGQIIGFATAPIVPGDHVHTHNLHVGAFARDGHRVADAVPRSPLPIEQRRTFLGYRREDGRTGTRNYIAVLATVNCSAHTVRAIAHAFTPERLAAYPNVDGVIAIAHQSGCATRIGGDDYRLLQRTMAGIARHPNVAAYLLVGLGCETNQLADLIDDQHLQARDGQWPPHLTIQESGGIRRTVAAGVAAVEHLLPIANAAQRTPVPISELTVALQCGGSDGWSGVTANPVVGLVSDEIVRQGGTTVLAETPEIYGAEHLLLRRAVDQTVADKLARQIEWWERYTERMGLEIDNNPSPGNKAGGLTTIYEKSLGAVAKGGNAPLCGVFDYAEPITTRGFTFMDSPGYDPVSVTGQVASGCNIVLFTTGRGSCFGFKPAPSIKIATNMATYERMTDDMDLNAGKVLDGVPLHVVAAELLDLVIAVASGEPSKSEAQDVGESEFSPWHVGGPL